MALNPAIDVTAEQRKTLLALLAKHLPNTAAWVYGSRAKWTSRPQSDLDMVVFAAPQQNGRVNDLREAFEESNLPFRVDLFVWDNTPEQFRKQIEAEHAVLVENGNQYAGAGRPIVTLGDCIEINDSTYSPKEAWPFVNYLDTGNITGNRISQIQHLVTGKDKIPSRARRKVRPGDIVYSTVRPNQRHFGILKQVPENFLASTGFSVIRGKDGFAHTNFIYWFLTQDQIVEKLHTIAEHSTSAYPSIKPSDIERLEIPLPPLREQRAIARILGTLDDKIELNRRMNETLEAVARALFRSWFVDFDPVRAKMAGRDPALPPAIAALFPNRMVNSELGQIPEGWEIGCLGDVVEQVRDNENPLASPDVLFYHFSIPAFDKDHWPTTERGENIKSQKSRVFPGAILLSKLNPEIDRVWLVDIQAGDRAVCSTEFLVFRPRPPYGKALSYCLVRSPAFRQKLGSLVTGTSKSHQRAPADAILELPIILFPKPIVNAFEAAATAYLHKAQSSRRESRTLATLRDSLLPKLISGELQAQSANLPYEERSDG